jgi:hypothetical protein
VVEAGVEAVAPRVIARAVAILVVDDYVVDWAESDVAGAQSFLLPMQMLPIPPNKLSNEEGTKKIIPVLEHFQEVSC